MKIISSQPFLIVFYRKALPLFRFREKNSLPQSLPRQEGPFPVKGREPFPYFTIPYFLS
ncbi:MAG: hypothetical protein MRZ20_00170 [Dialister succinatiphilus]|nr:hypothetical protein [Dialister succinatiphilus]